MNTNETQTPKLNWKPVAVRTLVFFIPAMLISIGVLAMIYQTEASSALETISNNEQNRIELLREIVSSDFNTVVSDLNVLAQNADLQGFLDDGDDEHRTALESTFLTLAQNKGLYDQIRYLDETGMEIVRVNYNQGNPVIIRGDDLQNKGTRYYFTDAFVLNEGEIFISPLDLNVEQGQIEDPLKPMIRVGTPVFDSEGNKRGIVLLNYFGATLLDHLGWVSADTSSQIMLLNSDGYWLKGPNPQEEWGFMYEDRAEVTFGNQFPVAWSNISSSEDGQIKPETGLFTFATVHPLKEAWISSTGSSEAASPSEGTVAASEYYWKLVSFVPAEILSPWAIGDLGRLIGFGAGLGVILLAASITVGWLLTKRQIDAEIIRQHRDHLEEKVEERTIELKKATAQANEANRLKSEFLATMSHELRTPLNAMLGFTEIMMAGMGGEVDEDAMHMVTRIHANSKRLLILINDVLDLSKIEAKRVEVKPHPFSPKHLAKDLYDRMNSLAIETGLEFEYHVDTLLPDQIMGDESLIERMATNLLSNAFKFTKQGSISLWMTAKHDNTWTIQVRDTGIGIPPHALNYIFDPFRQIDGSSQRAYGGSGLGLAIVRELARAMNGKIEVESTIGEGSTFTVTLPLVTVQSEGNAVPVRTGMEEVAVL